MIDPTEVGDETVSVTPRDPYPWYHTRIYRNGEVIYDGPNEYEYDENGVLTYSPHVIQLESPLEVGDVIEAYQHGIVYNRTQRQTETSRSEILRELVQPTVTDINPDGTAIHGTGIPGVEVVVETSEGVEIGRRMVDEEGNFEIPLGPSVVEGQVIELFHEEGERHGERYEYTVPDLPDVDPILYPMPQVDEVTHLDTEIAGLVNPEYSDYDVILTDLEGTEIGRATPNEDGNFTISVEGLEPGQELLIVQVDEAGNQVSIPARVTVERGIEEPAPLPEPEVEEIDHTDPEISGSVDPENADYEVIIRDQDGNEVGRGTPDEEGNFTIPVENLEPGQELEVVQVDEDGNDVSESAPITVGEGEETPIPEPEVEEVAHTDPEISGSVDPENAGYEVVVRDQDGNEVGRGTPDEEGNFTIPVENLELGQELEVIQVDEEGNDVSEPTPVVVGEEVSDLLTPELNPITDQDTVITGRATEETLAVILYVNGVEIGRVTPDEFNSPFEFNLDSPLPVGTVVQARHVNSEGVLSGVATQIVTSAQTPVPTDPIQAPEAQTPEVDDESITGVVADPSRPVVIIVGEERYEVMPNPDGSFRLDLDEPLEPGTVITIFQLDEDGNPGESLTFIAGEGLVSRDMPEGSSQTEPETIGERLPQTATSIWILGAAGLGITLLGLAAKLFKKDEK